jgi:hypothetical protein
MPGVALPIGRQFAGRCDQHVTGQPAGICDNRLCVRIVYCRGVSRPRAAVFVAGAFFSRFHLPAPLGPTVVTRFIATMGALHFSGGRLLEFRINADVPLAAKMRALQQFRLPARCRRSSTGAPVR